MTKPPKSKKGASTARTTKQEPKPKVLAKSSSQPLELLTAKPATTAGSVFSVGARVSHRKFGSGVVMAVDGDKLEIKFKGVGVKWVFDNYVESL